VLPSFNATTGTTSTPTKMCQESIERRERSVTPSIASSTSSTEPVSAVRRALLSGPEMGMESVQQPKMNLR
jgi:hypothetical protein